MKSLANLRRSPAAIPIVADDVPEFHAARLLLLLMLCGTRARVQGLTKMAKLDFFLRYPQFFKEACRQLGIVTLPLSTSSSRAWSSSTTDRGVAATTTSWRI